ncbi:MAG: hypothetical protein KAT68_14405 [Bacteroidales bacterium]|nr:hypothetical protein [Bacteroidales bacterium]
MTDPLAYLYKKFGFDSSNIKKIVTGEKYTAILINNGNIGVCANLMKKIKIYSLNLTKPDINKIEYRIILNAYYNALLNYSNEYEDIGDIFDIIDFKKYKNPVMIGLFKPIIKKFRDNNMEIKIFDRIKKDSLLIPGEKLFEYLSVADTLIVSSTTVFNQTFSEIINNSNPNCDIFLLGPSSIMLKEIYSKTNIKYIFGTIFNNNDENILNIINDGRGTKDFQPLGEKVALKI